MIQQEINVDKLNNEMANSTPQEVLAYTLERFGNKVALACSFGAEDVVLIDMMVKIRKDAKIFTLDTGRLHQETYDVMERIINKYDIKIEVFSPDNKALEKMVIENGPNLFYKSVDLRKLCCGVRKIEPLKRALSQYAAWICGLRKEQSVTRTAIHRFEIDKANNNMYKINPLVDWTEKDIWDYIKKNKVPYNKLHDQNFPSIGCAPCTRAVKYGEDIRAGRWWWESPETKECGLHAKNA